MTTISTITTQSTITILNTTIATTTPITVTTLVTITTTSTNTIKIIISRNHNTIRVIRCKDITSTMKIIKTTLYRLFNILPSSIHSSILFSLARYTHNINKTTAITSTTSKRTRINNTSTKARVVSKTVAEGQVFINQVVPIRQWQRSLRVRTGITRDCHQRSIHAHSKVFCRGRKSLDCSRLILTMATLVMLTLRKSTEQRLLE
mmetsp:Transcript_43035/g.68098  ORF Transcript_43035/g.68098 Transcript_43035/m.68098 type:complete len:205 (+) Transcript_43035:2163-2777(+)